MERSHSSVDLRGTSQPRGGKSAPQHPIWPLTYPHFASRATRKRPYKAAKRQRPPLWQTISSTPGVLGGRGKDVLRADPLTIGPSDEIDQAGRGSSTADFSANRSDNG